MIPQTQTPSSSFGTKEFKDREEVQRILEKKVENDYVATRPGPSNMKLTYLESWKVVELSNALFGFDGWSCCITNMNVDFIDVDKGKFKVGVTAIIRVTLKNGSYHEDVGVGMSDNPRKGAAIELAKKEAVSDGRKRALRLFGNYLGNSLYDRDYVRQMDTNHKSNSIAPVTFDDLRNKFYSDTQTVGNSCTNGVNSNTEIKTEVKKEEPLDSNIEDIDDMLQYFD
ncbi:DNA repair and recombination protein Rad22 [Entamoeba marina]